jgi:ferredoxin-type protein NapH
MDWPIIADILRLTALGGLCAAGVIAVLLWKKNLATRVTLLRLLIQAVAFAAIFYVFSYSAIIPMLIEIVFIFGLTVFLGRFYCGWLCPMGLVLDLEIMGRRALKIRHRIIPDKLNLALHKSRYVILLFILLLPIVLYALNPQEIMVSPLMAQLLAGYYRPYSIVLDPMIPFIVPWTGQLIVGPVNLSFPYIQEITTYITGNIGSILAVAFVGVVLVGGFFIRRVWCRFCPTGASLGVLNRFKGLSWIPLLYVEKDEEKCTKCGVCKRVCSVQVNEVYDQKGGKIKTSQCMVCTRCVEMCPYEDTLKLKLGNKTLFRSRNWLEQPNTE